MASNQNSTQEVWALHSAQQDMLQAEAENQPLVGPFEKGFATLATQFEGAAQGFRAGLKSLETRNYKGFRRIRGDGNCFFRGFMFRLVEILATSDEQAERKRLVQFMKDSLAYLLSAGYQQVSVETFQEMIVEFFEDDILKLKSSEDVVTLFNNKGESEHLVWYSRVLCAAYMKLNGDRFLPFLDGNWISIDEYCSREVEPQGKECEQVHIIALAEVLNIKVSIEYLSSASGDSGPVVLGPEESTLTVKFIYRPGHYDVLYD